MFTNLAAYTKPRADLAAILLTGIPASVGISGFQNNNTGTLQADQLRLNMAIPAKTSGQSSLGILGGDLAGFPNGRRVFDDVATIELRAIAGATIPLVDSSFTPDPVVKAAPAPFADTTRGTPVRTDQWWLGPDGHGDRVLPRQFPVPGYSP